MPKHDPAVREFSFVEPVLTQQAVAELDRTLRARSVATPLVIDCRALMRLEPAGLSALLELGRNTGGLCELLLTDLSRPLLLAAIDVGLAERFTIFTTRDAAIRELGASESDACAH